MTELMESIQLGYNKNVLVPHLWARTSVLGNHDCVVMGLVICSGMVVINVKQEVLVLFTDIVRAVSNRLMLPP